MIYSTHDDHNGGFLYYEAGGPAINADFQTPSLRQQSPLGVPAVEAARPLPSSARQVGRGSLPKGAIARRGGGQAWGSAGSALARGVDPSGLGLDVLSSPDTTKLALAGLAGVLVFLVARKVKLPLPAQAVLATGTGALVYGISPIKAAIVGVLPP